MAYHAGMADQSSEDGDAAAPDAGTEVVLVPHTELAADVLRAVIESFVLREGTDYGEREFSLERKVADVTRQIERGEAQISFDPQTASVSVTLVSAAARRSR